MHQNKYKKDMTVNLKRSKNLGVYKVGTAINSKKLLTHELFLNHSQFF